MGLDLRARRFLDLLAAERGRARRAPTSATCAARTTSRRFRRSAARGRASDEILAGRALRPARLFAAVRRPARALRPRLFSRRRLDLRRRSTRTTRSARRLRRGAAAGSSRSTTVSRRSIAFPRRSRTPSRRRGRSPPTAAHRRRSASAGDRRRFGGRRSRGRRLARVARRGPPLALQLLLCPVMDAARPHALARSLASGI